MPEHDPSKATDRRPVLAYRTGRPSFRRSRQPWIAIAAAIVCCPCLTSALPDLIRRTVPADHQLAVALSNRPALLISAPIALATVLAVAAILRTWRRRKLDGGFAVARVALILCSAWWFLLWLASEIEGSG